MKAMQTLESAESRQCNQLAVSSHTSQGQLLMELMGNSDYHATKKS